jgi:hypothetical protein
VRGGIDGGEATPVSRASCCGVGSAIAPEPAAAVPSAPPGVAVARQRQERRPAQSRPLHHRGASKSPAIE